MNKNILYKTGLHAAFLLAMGVPLKAFSSCSRVINVPISSVGLSVIASGDKVSGVYPDLLRSLASKGCRFEFSVVPRARLEAMFEAGKADLLIPASKSPRRDEYGVFVPLIFSRPMVISMAIDRPPIRTVQDLLDQPDLRIALVRGYDFGDVYSNLIKELAKQGRVTMEVDPKRIARLMEAGLTDVTIMTPSILAGAIYGEPGGRSLLAKLQYESIAELPWGDSGAYISHSSISQADMVVLRELLEQAARSGAVWKAFQRYYPQEALDGSIRRR